VSGSGRGIFQYAKSKSKAIPVTGLGGLYGCEMLRIPHFLDKRLKKILNTLKCTIFCGS
jgi:hypothetical protein